MRGMTSLIGLAGTLPYLVIDVVALSLAVARWSRHPMASMFLCVGVVLRLVAMLTNVVFARAMSGGDLTQMGVVLGLSGLVSAAGYALTVVAVFAGREKGDEAPRRVW